MSQNVKIENPLRKFATKVTLCDGLLNVWILPHTTKLVGLIYTTLSEALIPKNQWFVSSNEYTDLAGCIVDIELQKGGEDNMEAATFHHWFVSKTNDFMQDYLLFMQIVPHEFIKVLHEDVFTATRPKLPSAPEITQQVAPGLNSPLDENGSAKTKKRTRKRTKSTS